MEVAYRPGRTQRRDTYRKPDAERPKSVWQTGYGPVVHSLTNAPVRDMGRAGCAEDRALNEYRIQVRSVLSLSKRAKPYAAVNA